MGLASTMSDQLLLAYRTRGLKSLTWFTRAHSHLPISSEHEMALGLKGACSVCRENKQKGWEGRMRQGRGQPGSNAAFVGKVSGEATLCAESRRRGGGGGTKQREGADPKAMLHLQDIWRHVPECRKSSIRGGEGRTRQRGGADLEAMLHLLARYLEMRPLLRSFALPMKEEWKMRPYLGVLPLVFRALKRAFSAPRICTVLAGYLAKFVKDPALLFAI